VMQAARLCLGKDNLHNVVASVVVRMAFDPQAEIQRPVNGCRNGFCLARRGRLTTVRPKRLSSQP
jgi:hypothetical protein